MASIQLPVYGPFEVIVHNTPSDCWVSFLGKVLNITPIIKQYIDNHQEDIIKPLLAFAGKDLSHWFDERTGDIRHFIHPITGVQVPYCPHGKIPDVSPYQLPSPLWTPPEELPWWKDEKYQIGILTKSVRLLRIINMLIRTEVVINVCCEDNFYRILERYSMFNSEADSYTWVHLSKVIEMHKTLDENGISDDRETMADLGIPKSFYIPSVCLYYNDDMRHLDDDADDEETLLEELNCVCKKPEELKM